MGGNGPNNEGRVTTREFFNAQLDTNKEIAAMALKQSEERAAMEIRILEKLDGLPTQVQDNKDEIKTLRTQSRWTDVGLGALMLVVNVIADTWRSR